jgi:hypothetical protein
LPAYDVARCIHQQDLIGGRGRRRFAERAHPRHDRFDDLIAKGSEAMLSFDAERASLPILADLVQHWGDHADQDVDWPAACADCLIEPRRPSSITPSSMDQPPLESM